MPKKATKKTSKSRTKKTTSKQTSSAKSNSKNSTTSKIRKDDNFIVKWLLSVDDWKLFFARATPLAFGILWTLVGLIDELRNASQITLHGLFYASVVGLLIILISVLSWFHHLIGGILLIAAGFYATMLIWRADILMISRILMIATLALPLVIPGLYFSRKGFTVDNLPK
jgi:hypothetical protein